MVKLSATSVGLPMALILLLRVFYIFNIEYPAKAKRMYIFLEAMLLDNNNNAKKSVVVQKCLKEISKCLLLVSCVHNMHQNKKFPGLNTMCKRSLLCCYIM